MLALTLVGCGTPYQPMGVRGGYEDHPIGNGIIAIHVRGNGYTSAGTVLEYAYRRAGEVCSNGFDPIDGQASTSSSWQRNGNTVNEVDKHEMTVLVHCREPVAEEPPHGEMPERHQQPIPVSTEPDPDAPAPGRVIRSPASSRPLYIVVDLAKAWACAFSSRAIATPSMRGRAKHRPTASNNRTRRASTRSVYSMK